MLVLTPLSVFANDPKTINWENLIPKDWNPNSVFDPYTDEEISTMSDEDYFILQQQAQAMFDAAPTVDKLNGETVKIPGYVLPLEFDNATKVTEFLLVPYYGACIHTPPPPANQMIHAKLESPFILEEMFTAVWISGKIEAIRSENLYAESGYSMAVSDIELYEE